MESVWRLPESGLKRERLEGKIKVDAVVIGAGMAGVLTALFLQRKGLNVAVLEAEETGSGQTRNTTAKITIQHGLFYARAIERSGREKIKGYADACREAVEQYRRLAGEFSGSCEFEECASWLYTQSAGTTAPHSGGKTCGELLQAEEQAARSLGIAACMAGETELPFSVDCALGFDGQAMFHPLLFLREAASRLKIYEHTRAVKAEGRMVYTDHGEVEADHIVFATHYPFLNVPGFYFMRMHQERSYCVAAEGAAKLRSLYYGIDPGGLSFRSGAGRLIISGCSHRTGERGGEDPYERLKSAALHYYPGCRITNLWSAQDCMPLDDIPYIGRYSRSTPDWYVATGFKKWGMTSAMVSAMLLSELITEGKSPYAEVFSPQRSLDKSALPELWREGVHSVKGLTKNFWGRAGSTLDGLEPGQGAVIRWKGKKYGAYRDDKGQCHLTPLRCPHLGCRLEWNGAEKSWDCPCHGSRFTCDGELIDNPAQRGAGENRQN